MFEMRRFQRRNTRGRGRVLGHRRIKVRRITFVFLALSAGVLVALFAWLFRLDQLLIGDTVITGNSITSTEALEGRIEENLAGTYIFIVPKQSTLFYPESQIEEGILHTFPRIMNVETSVKGKTTLYVDVTERKPFALWCGETFVNTSADLGNCYFLDEEGFIFAKAPDFTGAVFFKYFGSLTATSSRFNAPFGETFMNASEFRGLQLFLEGFEGFGYDPVSLTLRDENDFELELANSAKIIFGGGQSLNVILDNLQSVVDSDVFRSSTKRLEYIDLRFGNKVYYKFVGEEEIGG